jgi:hypothetical protein
MMLIILIFFKFIEARWDQITAIHHSGGGSFGTWRERVYCPNGSWAKGFRHFTNIINDTFYDETGTYFVELRCFNYAGYFTSAVQSIGENLGYADWSNTVDCSGTYNFIKGYKLKIEETGGTTGNIGVTGVRMSCTKKN